jgi:isoleucyl-tRNA synthetase
VKVAVWTTTPWTMPGNLAVAVNGQLDYSVVRHPKVGKLVVATELMDTLKSKLGLKDDESSWEVLATVKGDALVGTSYRHPLYDRVSPVLVGGDYITTESGTGLVHTGTRRVVEQSLRFRTLFSAAASIRFNEHSDQVH